MRHRLELVNPGCRRLPPRYATRFLPRPENASATCRFPGRAWPKHLARRNGLFERHMPKRKAIAYSGLNAGACAQHGVKRLGTTPRVNLFGRSRAIELDSYSLFWTTQSPKMYPS